VIIIKKLFLILGLTIILGAVYFGTRSTYAQTTTGTSQTIIERIAEKFGLKQADVQTVFDNYRQEKFQEMQKERKARLEEKLTEAVSSGKISQTQKQAILKKFDELQNKRVAERTDLENWTKQNSLDNLGMGMGFLEHKFGFGMH